MPEQTERRPAMAPRRAVAVALAAVGAAVALALLAATALLPEAGASAAGGRGVALYVSLAVAAVVAALAALGVFLVGGLIRPLERLAGDARVCADARGDNRIDPERYRLLAPLPAAVGELAERLKEADGRVNRAVDEATRRAKEQRDRLEALLRDLSEGVIVCNMSHQILLYNHMAVRLLGGGEEIGLGRTLFGFVTREPVLHTLEWLAGWPDEPRGRGAADRSAPLVCATADARTMLRGRMSLIVDERDAATGYVLTLADATQAIAALARRDALLGAAVEGLRGPVANLRAAAETLAGHPEMGDDQRRAFERILVHESAQLSDRLAGLADERRALVGDYGSIADLHSGDLLNCVIRRAREKLGVALTMTGLPQWLSGDSYALMLVLSHLVDQVRRATGVAELDVEAGPRPEGSFVDVVWAGEPLPSALLSSWLEAPLEGSLGGVTVRQVLERHHSELWSQIKRPGHACLRVPLPKARRADVREIRKVPRRPEFYDFDLLKREPAPRDLGTRPLRQLTLVAFDTETTGMRADLGDEIVALAGVRMVNGRILTGETFDRLVNPGRPIPKESTRVHRIGDEMVKDKPPIQVVLPQFKAFVAGAVLVGHNIAFDLSFLDRRAAEIGLRFDNPILDTLLLSTTLHEHAEDHSLDALARRYGIEVVGRHTALGDSMMTAAALGAMFEPLERRGIRTLEEAMGASRVIMETRARRAQLAAAGA
jgi:DNA polymerase-3 subunit epsilon